MQRAPPRYVKPGVAEKQLGVDRRTLQKWAQSGIIRSIQPGGAGRERLFDVSSVESGPATAASVGPAPLPPATAAGAADDRINVVYARVSTRKQLDDLATQLRELQQRHPDARAFSDVGSGLNFKRKGLQALLELAFEGRLRSVYVAHKDRLCRFAFDLVEFVLAKHGAQIVVDAHADDAAASPELELAEDVLAVVTVFGARLYGKRSAGNRRRNRNKRKRGDPGAPEAPAHGEEATAGGGDGGGGVAVGEHGAEEAQGGAGAAPAGLGWAAADLQGAHGLDSGSEEDAEGVLCGGALGVQ